MRRILSAIMACSMQLLLLTVVDIFFIAALVSTLKMPNSPSDIALAFRLILALLIVISLQVCIVRFYLAPDEESDVKNEL